MANQDNSATISEIEAIQNEGARSVSVDGVTVSRDFGELRRRKQELVRSDSDAATRARRPRLASVNLNNSF